MTEITAALVKELRDRTGAGMMECKKALVQSAGDMEAAVEWLRKSGLAKAVKRAGKTAAEGIIAIQGDPAGHSAAMVEVNCETDFVAKGEDFQSYARAVAGVVLAHRPKDLMALMAVPIEAGAAATVETRRQELSARIGENINVRRFSLMENPQGLVAHYLHGTRIGVLVEVVGGDSGLARDIAMHVAASRPVCVSEAQVPAQLLEKEREIYRAQAAESGKPANIIDKIVEGQVKKFVAESTLLGQPFVKDTEITVGKLLAGANAEVRRFERFEVGEGIERQTADFAAEVMAQVRGG